MRIPIAKRARALLSAVVLSSVVLSSVPDTRLVAREPGGSAPGVLLITETKGYVPEVLLTAADPAAPPGAPEKRCLVHQTVVELGAGGNPFRVVRAERAAPFLKPEVLARFRCVVLYTSGHLDVSEANVRALVEFVQGGGGLIGVHAAVATFAKFPAFADMLGAKLAEQPWHERIGITLHDSYHPAALPVRPYWKIEDRILRFRDFQAKDVRVLMSMDMTSVAPALRLPHHIPVAWVRRLSQGRVFYTSLGYRPEVWRSPAFRAHLRGGILWAMGAKAGSDEPNPRVSAALGDFAREVTRAATSSASAVGARVR